MQLDWSQGDYWAFVDVYTLLPFEFLLFTTQIKRILSWFITKFIGDKATQRTTKLWVLQLLVLTSKNIQRLLSHMKAPDIIYMRARRCLLRRHLKASAQWLILYNTHQTPRTSCSHHQSQTTGVRDLWPCSKHNLFGHWPFRRNTCKTKW